MTGTVLADASSKAAMEFWAGAPRDPKEAAAMVLFPFLGEVSSCSCGEVMTPMERKAQTDRKSVV